MSNAIPVGIRSDLLIALLERNPSCSREIFPNVKDAVEAIAMIRADGRESYRDERTMRRFLAAFLASGKKVSA